MMRKLKFLFLEVIENKNGVFGFEAFDLFEELLKEINVDGNNLLVRAVDALVKAFFSVHQFDEAYDVLLKIQGGFLLSVLTCNLFLNRLVEEGKVDMAMMVYQHLKMKGFLPNVYTYGIVVKGLCRTGCVKEAGDVLESMKEAGAEPNMFTFGSYIDGLCSNGYTDSAFELLKMLKEPGSLIDVFAYASVIRGFVKELKLQDAENDFFNMKQAAIVPDA
ncbi:Pentatricopeptide repeat-containing protein [Cynara cardunculus var. scolymus]|uniref:Pentatricopeptide repeat-containing protein n=1 Tax=Cynara cardunculus var. scolymus TaxID=59895 RepID=A0A103XRX4_CYNCS|nr:Pentatricopeptide repeat-containing protein [Cynara cardunculus var. scolymus]